MPDDQTIQDLARAIHDIALAVSYLNKNLKPKNADQINELVADAESLVEDHFTFPTAP